MSTTIDTNVVQLRFDNKQFEENCKQSMSTLEKLKQKINESSSGNALKDLNKVDLTHLSKSVDAIANRFTFLGNTAFKIKDKISDAFLGMAKTLATTVPRIIKEGGWQRAMNIEEAKFQLEGLKVAWNDIKDDIDYAVSGTAYGLDAAAKAASQLVASNVQVGDSMKTALRGISGVAAMTNSEYEEISQIFTKVAGNGRLMGDELQRLSSKGLNAAAILGQQLGKTESQIREMVTKGEIDFATFAKAMDDAFGEHAKDADRTFTGVVKNIKAALKKIGADFSTPIIEQDGPVVKALQVLKDIINDVRKSLGPLNEAWTAFVYNYGRVAEKLLKSIDMSFIESVTKGLVNTFNALLSIIRPIGYALRDVFGASANSSLQTFAQTFESFTAKLILSKEEMEDLRATVRGVLSIFTIFTTVIKQILGAILQVKPETVDIGAIILKITGSIGDMITFIAYVIKQLNIIEPIISGISTVIKTLIGLVVTGGVKVGEFITKLSQLKVTSKIIDGVTFAIKALVAGVMLLASIIKDFVVNTVNRIPSAISAIKTELQFIFDLLSGIPIVQTAANYIMNLAKSFDKLLHPNKSDAKELENVITIADEAVALAGPQQISTLEKFINTVKSVISKVTEMSGSIVQFIKNIDYGAIAAVTFTLAIAGIGYKLSQTFQSITDSFNATANAIKQIGGFIGSFQNRSIMEFIFGKKDPPEQHKLLEFAAAMIAVAGSVKLMTTIDANKLKEVGNWLGAFGVGLAALATVFTILQKKIGKGETLAITNALFAIGGSIALMVAALDLATKLDFTNIQKAGFAITQLSVVLTGMAIALAKLAPALSTSSISLLAMAYSLKIMVGVLDSINKLHINSSLFTKSGRNLWGKAGLLMTVAGGLVIISGIAAKLGTNSLLGILIALGSLKLIIPLANTIATQIQTSIFADMWHKMVDFFVNIKSEHPKLMAGIAAFVAIGAAIAGIIGAIYLIKKAFIAIKNLSTTITQTNEKFAGLQKALARLSLVPVIVSLTGMAVAIGVMVGILGKIKLPYIDQAIKILAAIGLMFVSLAVVVAASKDAKPGAIIGAMVGLSMMFSELIILTLLVERHWKSMITACRIMGILMLSLSAVFYSISKASQTSTKTLIAIGMVGGIIAELGGILYILSQQDWLSVAAAGVAMRLAMVGFAKMLEEIGSTGQNWTKNEFIAMAEAAGVVALIGYTIAQIAKQEDWLAIAASGIALRLAMTGFAGMVSMIGEADIKMDLQKFATLAECAVATIAIGKALEIATQSHDWQAILAAGASVSGSMIAFALMARLLGTMDLDNAAAAFAAMLGIAVTAVAIGASLTMLCQYPWQEILAAAVIMAGLTAVLSGLAIGLGAIYEFAIPGAIALDLIAVAMLGVATSATMLLGALTAFLPIANVFLDNVLSTLVGFGPELPSTALGLTELAGGLALVGAAGVALTAGSAGLLMAAAGLTALIPGATMLSQIDFVKIGSGLMTLVAPASLLAPIGIALLAATPGFTVASVALIAFGAAVTSVAKSLNDKTIKEMEKIPEKMVKIGKWIPKSLANGINGEAKTAINAAKDLASKIESTIRNKLDIHSESPLLKNIGGWIPKSVGNGVKTYINGALGPVGRLGTSIISSLDGTAKEAGNSGTKITTNLGNSLNSGLDWVEQKAGLKLDNIRDIFKEMQTYSTLLGGSGADTATDANAAKQEQINARKKLAEATKEATAAEEDFGKAAKGGGKAAKEEKEEIKDLSKAFEAVAKSTKKTLSQMSNNLAANLKETYSWAEDMKIFMAQTWDDTTKKWVESLGVAGHDTLRAFINATEEEAAVFKDLMPQYLTLDEDSKAMIAGDYSGLGLQIMQQYGEGIGLYSEELAENIQNAIKPFEAFNKELDVTKYQLMENLESQVKGVNEWADQLIELSNRAINENLLEYLRDMGPEGYKYVMAFGSMTDEELAKTNDLWQQTMDLGVNTAKKLYPTQYNNLGKAITEGFDNGIDQNKMVGTIGNALDATVAKARAIYDWHSPSGLMLRMGQDIGNGFVNGINQVWDGSVIPTVTRRSEEVVNTFKMQFNESTGQQLAQSICQGIVNGFNGGWNWVVSAARDLANAAWEAAKNALDSHSPSRKFEKLGLWSAQGYANGVVKNAGLAEGAVKKMGDSTVQMMNDIIKNITSEINDAPELQPVIRPRLDLTALQNGKRSINGMFGGSTISLANDVLANKMSADSINPTVSDSQIVNNQNFIFNQTNNSPKALDAYEIYRNSRNLLGQIKGAKA